MILEVINQSVDKILPGLEGQIRTFAIIGAIIGVLVTLLTITALISVIVIARKLCQMRKDGLKVVPMKKGYFEG